MLSPSLAFPFPEVCLFERSFDWRWCSVGQTGLCYQLFSMPRQGVLFGLDDKNFIEEFMIEAGVRMLKTRPATVEFFLCILS